MGDKKIIDELRKYEDEEEWFEFKENWFVADELGEYISALSNSAALLGRKNAYFVWGIHDKTHKITGTNFNPNKSVKGEPLKHYLARQLSPDVNFIFEEYTINKKKVVLLTIPAAKTVPLSFAKERYIRIGSSKENLQKFPEKESFLFEVLRHGFPTIENTPSEYQNLTFEKLLIYYAAKGIKLNKTTFKKNLSLKTEDGKYNLLAQLLSDNSHFSVRVAIFSGTSKSDNMYSVREFGNQCILYTLDEILRYGDVLNILQADEKDRVVERKEISLFENDAFREAAVNAFVHNKWVSGNEPMITIYSDRIEILSRGTIPPEQTMEGFFKGESVPVNKKLSDIFLQLHISEKTGRGVPRITSLYGKDAFEFRENSIVVKIPFNWINVMGNSSAKNKMKTTETKKSDTLENVLTVIRNNPNITKSQICLELELGKTTIDNAISVLRKTGRLERIGSNKTGYWKIKKK